MVPGAIPPPGAVPNYNPNVVTNGPLDDTERNVSMVWTCVGTVAACLWILGTIRVLTEYVLAGSTSEIGYSMLSLLLSSWLLTFLIMRMRRLYLTAPGQFSPVEIQARRSRFSVSASVGIVLLVLVGIGLSAAEVIEERQKQAKIEAQERQEKEEAAARERAELAEAARREEAERRARMEEASSPVYSTPSYVPSRAYTPMPSFPRPSFPRPRSSGTVNADPSTLPCGDRFSRIEPGGTRGNPENTAYCVLDHRFHIRSGRWTAAR
jgi:hypothetical protein